jgi:hypothetical protein
VTYPLFGGQDLTDFVALYRGRTVSEAELVAVSAEPQVVHRLIKELLGERQTREELEKETRMRTLESIRGGGRDERK